MKVLERFSRIVRADAHGMMDQMEERSLLLKQHLREAELEVARKRTELEALEEERRTVAEDGQRLESEVASLDEDVEIARRGEDVELARFAVRRWLPKREALRVLLARAARLEERRNRLADRLERQEARLAELRTRVRAALERPDDPAVEFAEGRVVTDEEIDLELLRRREVEGEDLRRGGNGEEAAGRGASRCV